MITRSYEQNTLGSCASVFSRLANMPSIYKKKDRMNEQEMEISNICKTKCTYAFARELKFESEFPFFHSKKLKLFLVHC